jgi:DNA modification methylase
MAAKSPPAPKLRAALRTIAEAVQPHSAEVVPLANKCLAIRGDNRDVLAAIPNASVHCTITSPPYGDQKNYGSPDEIGSGNRDYEAYLADIKRVVRELQRVTVNGGVMWLVLDTLKRDGQSLPLPFQAIEIAKAYDWIFHECVIWDKGKSLPWSHHGHFRGVFEYILLFGKGRIRQFDLDAVRESDHLSSYWVKYPERFNPLGKAPSDLWHVPIPVQGSWSKSDLRHLCPFPNDLVRRMVALTSKPGDVVLDPFSGTGIVPALASSMDRLGLGIELNKRYYRTFVSTGFKRITESQSVDHIGHSASKLARLIQDLRVLKYPKSLFAQISRADRLGDGARSRIAAFLVNRDGDQDTAEVKVSVLAANKADVADIERACSAAIAIPPLSKFGLVATVSVLAPSIWQSSQFRPVRQADKWYRYQAGMFNAYSERIGADEMKAALRNAFVPKDTTPMANKRGSRSGAKARRTRVPPIFSRLGVKVLRAIDD